MRQVLKSYLGGLGLFDQPFEFYRRYYKEEFPKDLTTIFSYTIEIKNELKELGNADSAIFIKLKQFNDIVQSTNSEYIIDPFLLFYANLIDPRRLMVKKSSSSKRNISILLSNVIKQFGKDMAASNKSTMMNY